jgi:hypothetical protein
MLAGHPPYAATTPVALAEAQDAGAEPLLNVAPALDNAVRRALSPDPADRPSDVAAFAHDLQAALANQPTELIVGLPAVGAAVAGPEPDLEPKPAAEPESALPVNAFGSGPMWPAAASAEEPGGAAPAGEAATAEPHRHPRPLPAALAAVFALIFAGIVLAAIAPSDGRPSADGAPARATVAPSPSPTVTPPPALEKPKEDKGKGNDGDKGKGNGGDDDD